MTDYIVFAGDSNIEGSSYAADVLGFLGNPNNVITENVGLNGLLMAEAVAYYEGTHATKVFGQTPLSQRQPNATRKIMFIGTGTNDIFAGTTFQTIVNHFSSIVSFYQGHGYEVYPMSVLPLTSFHGGWALSTAQLMIDQWQSAGWDGHMNSHKAVLSPPSADYFSDNVHISGTGQIKVSRLIAAALAVSGLGRLTPMFAMLDKPTLAENKTDFDALNAEFKTLGGYPNASGTSDYAAPLYHSDGIQIAIPILPGVLNRFNQNRSFESTVQGIVPDFISKLTDTI